MYRPLLFLLLTIGCSSNDSTPQTVPATAQTTSDSTQPNDRPPFDLTLQLHALSQHQYQLSANLMLKDGDYVISALSSDSVYDHFEINLPPSDYLTLNDTLIEEPLSIEEFDPIIQQPVRFIRQNTVIQKPLTINTTSDFNVSGKIELVLEPHCIPYDVSFVITSHSGVVRIEQIKTTISSEYKAPKKG